jgi:hypothetical protein
MPYHLKTSKKTISSKENLAQSKTKYSTVKKQLFWFNFFFNKPKYWFKFVTKENKSKLCATNKKKRLIE